MITSSAQRPPTWRIFGTAGLAYSLVAVAITFPLILHLNSTVPHDIGDPLLSTCLLWWNAHVTPLTAKWWNPPWFYPAGGIIAMSDHRLGASLIASPLQWLGVGPVAAYNLTLIASFPLSALAAFGLVFSLTRRTDAAGLAGLAYGFNPYRMAHIEHLELLFGFGMPLVLLALHRYVDTRKTAWVIVLAGALALQGLCSSYYLLFFSVFLAIWLMWFVSWRDWRALASIAAASLIALALLSPLLIGYRSIHHLYSLRRPGFEIEFQSADVTSLVTASPMLALWGWTSALNPPERQIFPGLAIAVLALVGVLMARRRTAVANDRLGNISRKLLMLASAIVAVAVAAKVFGPVHIEQGPIKLSIDVFYKPFTIAVLASVVACLMSPTFRAARRQQSLLAFYALATMVLLLFCLGPKPKILGQIFLYQPPYAWLTKLPLFGDAVRVPARFAMLAALALSVAGALGFSQIAFSSDRTRRLVWAVCLFAITADTWPRAFPLRDIPSVWDIGRASGSAVVMELPLGYAEYDSAAMYRSTFHRLPTINGMSGYLPPHYLTLAHAFEDRDPGALDAIASVGSLVIATQKGAEPRDHWNSYLLSHAGITQIGEDADWTFFHFTPGPEPAPAPCAGTTLHPSAASDANGTIDPRLLSDENADTLWATPQPQKAGARLTADFGKAAPICAVVFSLGVTPNEYPRQLRVSLSVDGESWREVFAGPTGGLAVRAALKDPRDVRVELPFAPTNGRYVRLELTKSDLIDRWALSELSIRTH